MIRLYFIIFPSTLWIVQYNAVTPKKLQRLKNKVKRIIQEAEEGRSQRSSPNRLLCVVVEYQYIDSRLQFALDQIFSKYKLVYNNITLYIISKIKLGKNESGNRLRMEHKNEKSVLDAVVIGAGHAGLSISYYMKQHNLIHIVFERDRIGESWRSQRWDSFVMNSSNTNNVLPGETYSGSDPEGFCTAKEFVTSLEAYSLKYGLPVKEHANVISVQKSDGEKFFTITVSENGFIKNYLSRQVVVASGSQNEKKVPSFAENISAEILQLHTAEYRSPQRLPEGAVLVVGSAQSGCQIAEDLLESKRKVYLSTSMVARVPRRYRGKDIVDWLLKIGFFNLKTEEVTDQKILSMRVPVLSGIGEYGHTLSIQLLAQKGATILGKMENAERHNVYFSANAHEHIQFADGFSQKIKDMIDEFILKNKISASLPEVDIADVPDSNASCASSITLINLKEHNIRSIIWSTGFNSDFSYLKLPVLDNDGNPKHLNGITNINGLYFLGLPWLRMRKSAMIFGINDDAEFITDAVLNNFNDIN